MDKGGMLRVVKLDHTVSWYLSVIAVYFIGISLAVGNHFYFAHLHNKDVSLYNQFWVTVAKNTWARAVQVCLIASSYTAFSALVWSAISDLRLPVRVIDSAFHLPSFLPALKILFSSEIKHLYTLVFWSICLFTLAFVTITVPGTLVVQPMESLPASLRVPNVDMSNDPRLYTVMTPHWEYVGPSNHLQRLVRNVLTSDAILTWNAPRACLSGCSYKVDYYAPVLRCMDYSPSSSDPGISSNTSYRANFNISDSYLTLNMTVWPMINGTHMTGSIGSSPLGSRCTFHNGFYTAAVGYWGSRHYASVTNYTRTSDDILLGTSLGLSNSSSCPRNSSWAISDPFGSNPCARIQMNTWAFVDAFSSSLSGAIVTYSQSGSLGPEERAVNNALMPNLDYLFSIQELYQSFDLAQWTKQMGLGKALESLLANATLSLTKDAYVQNWTSEAYSARVVPFANKFSYNAKTLWLGYGGAFITAFGAGFAGWAALLRKDVPDEGTSLAKILATTRDESFEQLRSRSGDIDEVSICYEGKHVGDDLIMTFTVKDGSALRRRSTETEEIGLLET
ncbi:unnamed protein product [Rhizoctonia solani]|uniref:Uncharacterized protein n=1 Tax=Rhizoctonia solani TaxID=456999 RepID=A0A8H3B6S8_9AGAM|nr:unnamed protein product [Rhizoctonia solani]